MIAQLQSSAPVFAFSAQIPACVLPTGQVMWDDGSGDLEVFTATGSPKTHWRPTIAWSGSTTVTRGVAYSLSGTQLSGVTTGASYGDDYQSATNYPLVSIRHNASGHVVYCRTHGHSTMGVATGGTIVSTNFDVPAAITLGPDMTENRALELAAALERSSEHPLAAAILAAAKERGLAVPAEARRPITGEEPGSGRGAGREPERTGCE